MKVVEHQLVHFYERCKNVCQKRPPTLQKHTMPGILLPLYMMLIIGLSVGPLRTWASSVLPRPEYAHRKNARFPHSKGDRAAAHLSGNNSEPESFNISGKKHKLYIHIGPHKTGTTYFQEWIERLGGISDTLLSPKICDEITDRMWFAEYAGHTCGLKKWALRSRWCEPTSNNLLRAVLQLPEGANAIISSEAFSQCNQEGFTAIQDALKDAVDIYVLGLRRDSRSLFLSRFHQFHKDFSKPENIWDEVTHGEHGFAVCSYMSKACIEMLAEVFGPDKVISISYEGLKAVNKELAEVVQEEFSESEKFEPHEEMTVKTNVSPSHLTYSAVGLYHRLRLAIGCKDHNLFGGLQPHPGMKGKAAMRRDSARAEASQVNLRKWLEELEEVGVHKNCLPVSVLHPDKNSSIGSDADFYEAVRQGDLPGRHLYYNEGQLFDLSEFCEYDETSVWGSLGVLNHLTRVIQDMESC